MKELAFCFCIVIGKECRVAGAFTIRQTGFECWPVKK